jgi:hypothetical protein
LFGPFPKRAKRTGVKYIITTIKYLTKWEEVELVKNCTKETMAKFIYENIVTRFDCPLTLINNQGTHFVNGTIEILLKKFMIDHRKMISYHPQANGIVESFNKTLHKGLTKICGLDRDDWDDKVPAVLWAYKNNIQNINYQTPFKLVYGQEVVIPLHFYANAGRITSILEFNHILNTRQCFYQLNQLEEERMLAQQHQEAQKNQHKSWHD